MKAEDWFGKVVPNYVNNELTACDTEILVKDEHSKEFVKVHPKQERYKQPDGEDWIDKCAKSFTPEEFRGAMKFTIGKYPERLGKKDSILKEVTKIADYANRWLEYETEKSKED